MAPKLGFTPDIIASNVRQLIREGRPPEVASRVAIRIAEESKRQHSSRVRDKNDTAKGKLIR